MSKAIRRSLAAVLVLAAVMGSPAAMAGAASTADSPSAPAAPVAKAAGVRVINKPGWTTTRTAVGTLSVSPTTRATQAEADAFLKATGGMKGMAPALTAAYSSCPASEDCLTLNGPYNTGLKHYVHPTYCPCYYVPVWKKSFLGCRGFEAYSVEACESGTVIYVPGYAACSTTCTIQGLRGTHTCGTGHTGSFGWSIDQVDCSATYLSTTSHASVIRNTIESCFVKFTICDSHTYHVNAYPSGSITGPYIGEGAM